MRIRQLSMWIAIAAAGVVPSMGQTPQLAQPAQKLMSQLDEQAQPAAIDFSDGRLMIRATNSSLRAILNDLQTRTGTRINGLSGDERIYGVYGPGNAQAVLASLLDDSGYNVLISGRNADGAPREIELSSRTGVQTAAAQPRGLTQAAAEADDSDDADSSPAPTAFLPPPPALPQPQAPGASGAPSQVKTPQEMLQELQRMRQGAQQQSPQ